ncbi:MAG: enoyl-CoA hydratase/isomerase family protein [Polaromonas sp.]|nr:enoyl-CoA hydratase/isomerase family protein [Polaromonas sp.]
MSEGAVHLNVEGGIASVLFDRPQARNAMTWAMYEQLGHICTQLQTNPGIRVVIFRGAGGEAFVAGTDIEQFQSFSNGDDGVAYERRIDHCIEQIERLPMPTLAVVEGWAVGGGLAIATACDFRIATPGSRFGVPIARTLGNCLSINNLARLTSVFGSPRVKRMLLLAELLGAEEALACGFLLQVCEPAEIPGTTTKLSERLASLAPVTQSVVKEGMRRLATHALPESEDLIRRCYASRDFREGVEAFVAKRTPVWQGV